MSESDDQDRKPPRPAAGRKSFKKAPANRKPPPKRGERKVYKLRKEGESGSDRPRGDGPPKRSFKPRGDGPPKRPFKSREDGPPKRPFKPRGDGPPKRDFKDRPGGGGAPRRDGRPWAPREQAGLKHEALIQIGAEIMHQFRHGDGPADRAFNDAVRARRFLGSSERAYLSSIFFHTLRHLRRIDESIISAFGGQVVAEERYSSGFPVMSPMGGRAWHRRLAAERQAREEKLRSFDRAVDVLRLGLAAMESEGDSAELVVKELQKSYPKLHERKDPMEGTLLRMTERAAEMMNFYRQTDKKLHQDRRHSFPAWLWGMLTAEHSEESLASLAEAMNHSAPVTLRVNTLKATMEQAEQALNSLKHARWERGGFAPQAIRLTKRIAKNKLPGLEEGRFEFQDEGSQLISIYAAPAPGMTVVDACAGGGGKALHMAALMENQGRIYAFDTDEHRLAMLPERAERNGAAILDLTLRLGVNGRLPSVRDLKDADLVVIDAPCTGTGTIRRNPEIKWRLTPAWLGYVQEEQRRLLDRWRHRVKPGGCLVYATCSLLAQENEMIIDEFLKAHGEWTLEAPESFVGPLTERGEMKLRPDQHGTDGFYAARLRKSS